MIENIICLKELMEKLGYKDIRSVKKWCLRYNISVIELGAKKGILSHYLTQYIDNQLVIFDKGIKNNQKEPDNKLKVVHRSYQPKANIINDYLSKYESKTKSNTTKKRSA